MRKELRAENTVGSGNSWTMSGKQWGSWNATFGAKGSNGRPIPLWDPKTGKIDHSAAEHWQKYDLRYVLENNWEGLAPKLQNKIHIWVGEKDNFFLNLAVHLLDDFLSQAKPFYNGKIIYGPGKGHDWGGGLSESEIQSQMGAAISATN